MTLTSSWTTPVWAPCTPISPWAPTHPDPAPSTATAPPPPAQGAARSTKAWTTTSPWRNTRCRSEAPVWFCRWTTQWIPRSLSRCPPRPPPRAPTRAGTDCKTCSVRKRKTPKAAKLIFSTRENLLFYFWVSIQTVFVSCGCRPPPWPLASWQTWGAFYLTLECECTIRKVRYCKLKSPQDYWLPKYNARCTFS